MSDPVHAAMLLDTPFAARTKALCITRDWGRWAGYAVPRVYTLVDEEYYAIRNTATLLDLSPLVKYRITGPDAERYLDRLTVRSVARLAPGRVAYTAWCDDDGKVLDDGTLFRLDAQRFVLCSQERHLDWLLAAAVGFDVDVVDASRGTAALALQGPLSCTVLRDAGVADIEWLSPFEHRAGELGGVAVRISRTGFTGDLGYELWMDAGAALRAWDALWAAGAVHGLRAAGNAALDLARLEAGFVMAGRDFVPAGHALRPSRRRSPYELGLGWLVDLDKPAFNGRAALVAERARGSRWALVGLDVEGNKPATDALVYQGRLRRAGHVTSAAWSPAAKRNVALATVRRRFADAGNRRLRVEILVRKELEWERTVARARIVRRPFYDPPRRRAVPAALRG